MSDFAKLHTASYLFAATLAVALLLTDRGWLMASGQEDQIAEYLTALLYLASSILVFAAYLASRSSQILFFGRPFSGSVWLLLLSIFLFVCFGEEISWAQRIFGWDTPEAWKAVNGHKETNLHNLLDHSQFSNERILTTIALGFGVFLPLADRFSGGARRAIRWIGVPVPPIATAIFFIVVFLTYRYLRLHYPNSSPVAKPLREYAEAGYAAAYFVVAASFFLDWRSRRQSMRDA